MIKQLQKKFIWMTMFFLGALLFVVLFLLCEQTAVRNEDEIRRALSWCLEATGSSAQVPALPSYTLLYDAPSDSYVLLGDRRNTLYDVESLRQMTDDMPYNSVERKDGVYLEKQRTRQGYIAGLVDASVLHAQYQNLISRSVVLFFGTMGVLFAAVWAMSRWIVRPVQEAWDAHKRFIADASHELKTPLTIILADCELLQAGDPENAWLHSLHEEALRMQRLIYDLLALARYDALPQAKPEPVDLSNLCQTIALEAYERAYAHRVLIEEDIESNVLAFCEPEDAHRLVALLVDNAVKYAPDQGVVSIRLKRKDHRFQLDVENPGTLTPEQMAHVFDRFYKADPSRKKDGSYGLGLSIAKEIASRNKLALSVTCQAGAITFSVRGKSYKNVR